MTYLYATTSLKVTSQKWTTVLKLVDAPCILYIIYNIMFKKELYPHDFVTGIAIIL